jgi:hypothetical protein
MLAVMAENTGKGPANALKLRSTYDKFSNVSIAGGIAPEKPQDPIWSCTSRKQTHPKIELKCYYAFGKQLQHTCAIHHLSNKQSPTLMTTQNTKNTEDYQLDSVTPREKPVRDGAYQARVACQCPLEDMAFLTKGDSGRGLGGKRSSEIVLRGNSNEHENRRRRTEKRFRSKAKQRCDSKRVEDYWHTGKTIITGFETQQTRLLAEYTGQLESPYLAHIHHLKLVTDGK